jgi:uncharacterized membrane protein
MSKKHRRKKMKKVDIKKLREDKLKRRQKIEEKRVKKIESKEKMKKTIQYISIFSMVIIWIYIFGTLIFNSEKNVQYEETPVYEENPSTSPNSPKQLQKKQPNVVKIPLSKVNDGKAHFYRYTSKTGAVIKYFVIKVPNGDIRAAFDACDICYEAMRGYRQDGDYMVCNNCGRRFHISEIGIQYGGCNPAPLESVKQNHRLPIQEGNVIIPISDLDEGVRFFR